MGDPGGSERLRILQSGNVGIGETSPDNILHITKDQGGAASALKLENKAGADNTGFDIDFQLASSGLSAKIGAVRTNSPGAGDSDIFFSTSTNGTSVTEAMRITHDSKVGIGTSSPYTKLNVVETGSGVINYPLQLSNVTTTNNSGVGIIFNVSSNSAYPNARIAVERTDSDASGEMSFWTTSGNSGTITERLRIDRNGNLGIGTSSPSEKLHVSGNAIITGDLTVSGTTKRS